MRGDVSEVFPSFAGGDSRRTSSRSPHRSGAGESELASSAPKPIGKVSIAAFSVTPLPVKGGPTGPSEEISRTSRVGHGKDDMSSVGSTKSTAGRDQKQHTRGARSKGYSRPRSKSPGKNTEMASSAATDATNKSTQGSNPFRLRRGDVEKNQDAGKESEAPSEVTSKPDKDTTTTSTEASTVSSEDPVKNDVKETETASQAPTDTNTGKDSDAASEAPTKDAEKETEAPSEAPTEKGTEDDDKTEAPTEPETSTTTTSDEPEQKSKRDVDTVATETTSTEPETKTKDTDAESKTDAASTAPSETKTKA